MEEEARPADLDEIARRQFFPHDDDPVDEGPVAALQVDKLPLRPLPDDLAVAARATQVAQFDVALGRAPNGGHVLRNLDATLAFPILHDELRKLVLVNNHVRASGMRHGVVNRDSQAAQRPPAL